MKNAFVIVTLSAALASGAASAAAPTVVPAAAPSADGLPKVALSSELLYRLLKSELELGAGKWREPYASLMEIAADTGDARLARRAAEIAVAAKQEPEGLAAVRLWRKLAPDSDDALQVFLGLAVRSDALAETEDLFARLLHQASGNGRAVAMSQIQQTLARAHDQAGAALMLERLLAPYADAFEAHVVLAQAAFARGAMALAQSEARLALAIAPRSAIAVLTLAQVQPDQEQVGKLLMQFLQANPLAHEVRTAYARILLTTKQTDSAREQFLILLKHQPEQLSTLYALGILAIEQGDPLSAEAYLVRFIEVLERDPGEQRDPAQVLLLLAQLAEERSDPQAALQWLEKIVGDDTGAHFSAQLKRAYLMGKLGQLEGARTLLASLAPAQPSAQVRLVLAHGQILRDAGQIAHAYATLEQGLQRFPGNPDLLYDFALVAEQHGQLDVMERSLRALMEQAPDSHHAYNALGFSLAERNVRLAEALALIEKALVLAPADPFIIDSMGWVQYRLGNLEQAAAHLRRAYALRNDVEIGVHLGEVLWQMGHKADAEKLWRAALAKDPGNDTLKNTLARLQQVL